MKQHKTKAIRWPKTKSTLELHRMSERQALTYARDLHAAHAENHRRSMEWDLYWVELYRTLLKEKP